MKIFTRVQAFFLDLFFPKRCENCGSSFGNGLSNLLCQTCFDAIRPYQTPACDRCGISLPERAFEDVVRIRCLDCGEEPSHLDQVWSFGAYEGPLRTAHHAFKFEGMEHLAKVLVERQARQIPASFWEGKPVLVPVPMAAEKEREKGYDPAGLMAQAFSDRVGLSIEKILVKKRSTVSQRSLTREQRLKNLKDSFEAISLRGWERFILVDDVMTTGATLEECAKVLKKAGAQWVGAVVWGRTPRHGSDRVGN